MVQEKHEIKRILKDYISKINKIVKIERTILFGSYARGDYKKGSDVDIVILSKDFEGKKYFERPAGFYLQWGKNYDKYKIDIICLTPEEFEMKKKEVSIIREVAKEGMKI